ncbi:MAG: hypothetical protein H6Q56_917 [Deltaproteobacteria bacterium]|nr:hypothetical protein [Deltaproteobacteria bacterium]
MKSGVLYDDQTSALQDSASLDFPCTRDNVRNLLQRSCRKLAAVDSTGTVLSAGDRNNCCPHGHAGAN